MNSPVTQPAAPQESSFWDEIFDNSPAENKSVAEVTPLPSNNFDSSNFDSSSSDFFSLENLTAPLRWARRFFSDETPQSSFVESFPDFEPPPEFSLSYYYDYTKKAVQYTLDAGEKFLLGTPSPASLEKTYPYSLNLDLPSYKETRTSTSKSGPIPARGLQAMSAPPAQPVDLVPIVPVSSVPIWVNSSLTDLDYFSYTPKRVETEVIDDETVIPMLGPAPVSSLFVTEEIFQPSVVTPVFINKTDPVSNLSFDSVFDAAENLQPDLNQPGSFVRTVVLEPRENGASLTTLSVAVPAPITEGGVKVLLESATKHQGPREIGTPVFLEKNCIDVSRDFSADEITALSHQSTIVKPSFPLIFDFASVGSAERWIDGNEDDTGRVILLPTISSSVILSSEILSPAILSPAMLALKHHEERTVAVALISGFVYIHGGMVSLFSSRDEWSGRVTDTLHAEHRAHILATVSAGSRSGQEDRQQKRQHDSLVNMGEDTSPLLLV